MARRFRAWLRSKLKVSGKTQRRAPCGSNPQTAAPSTEKDSSPPPYATSDLRPSTRYELPSDIDGSESLEVLRARNPASPTRYENCPDICPPPHTTSPEQAIRKATSAGSAAALRAIEESDPKMAAAIMAQGIAVAVSTARSYSAFVAAVTAAESTALLLVEDYRDNSSSERCGKRQRNALDAAFAAGIAAHAGVTPIGAWPFNIEDVATSALGSIVNWVKQATQITPEVNE